MSDVHALPYPDIVSCILEGRAPSLAELKDVARRVRREIRAPLVTDRLKASWATRLAFEALNGNTG